MSFRQKLTANFQQWSVGEKFIFGSESGLKEYLAEKEETERPYTVEEIARSVRRRKALDDVLN